MSRLIDEINKYKEAFKEKVPADVQEIMLNATKQLEEQSISKNALKVGSSAKEFRLPNAVGKEISLFDSLEQNDFIVVNFYRGVWCPYCNFEMKALADITDQLAQLNAKIIAVSPESPDLSLNITQKHDLKFEVLSDYHNKVAKEYGLVFTLAQELQPIYESFGIDVPGSNKEESYELPMPAVYVINKNKEIIFSFIDEDYTKRCEPQAILDVIEKNKN